MQHIKIVLFLFISLFSTSEMSAQTGSLSIVVYHDSDTKSPCFDLRIYNQTDTVHSQTIYDEEELFIENLADGVYSVNFTNCSYPSKGLIQSMTKTIEIKADRTAMLDFDLEENNQWGYHEIDTVTSLAIIKSRTEVQLAISYFDFRWNPDGNNPKFNLGLDYTGYYWDSFSKHFGFLIGGGIGFMFAPLQIDLEESEQYPEKIKSQYYNYWNGHFDAKFRFSTLNQQREDLKRHSVFIDLGVQYNLPIYFKRVSRFNIHDKLVNSFNHQYSDARVYVNVGFTNVQVFASYRPFDFIRGDYPELPRFNTGIKFNVNFVPRNQTRYGPPPYSSEFEE